MINLRPAITTALKNDLALTSLLGGQRVYFQVAPNAKEFPRITFFELDNSGNEYADDTEYNSSIVFQVDIWNQDKNGVMRNPDIADAVDRLLKTLGFERSFSHDFYEDDTKVYHTAMRFTTTKEL